MSLDPQSREPGWYPSPDGHDRWWTGQSWSDDLRPTPSAPTSPYPPAAESSGARNTAATVALVLGIVAMLVNPVLLVGIGAIIAGGMGLNRASLMGQHGYSTVGRAKAAWGLTLGLLATIGSLALKGGMF